MQSADVVIIGAGIQGLSVAAHLIQLGIKNIAILEMEHAPGLGATARSAAMILLQAHTGDTEKAQLTQPSLPEYVNFQEKYGVDIGFKQTGSILFTTDNQKARQLEEQVKNQMKLGISSKLVNHSEIFFLAPFLQTDDIVRAIYCEKDGYLDPNKVVEGYRKFVIEHGAKLYLENQAIGITLAHQKVVSVETTSGSIPTRYVVNAAGALADKVGKWVGINIPLRKTRRTLWLANVKNDLQHSPIIEDVLSEWYMRPAGKQMMIGVGNIDEIDGDISRTNEKVKPAYKEVATKYLSQRAPGLRCARLEKGWQGIRDLTPDQKPILGPVPEREGFVNCCGWSGYGVMHAPISGQLIAEYIALGKTQSFDIAPFLLSRF